jgi:hypothetical protein
MTLKRTPRPHDPIQLGKLMVDIATGQVPDAVDDGKDPAAVELGRRGGMVGGIARAKSLSSERRSEIAKLGSSSRKSKNTR